MEKFNFIVVIPPGVPCIKLQYRKNKNAKVEEITFHIFIERGSWYRTLNEIITVYNIYRYFLRRKMMMMYLRDMHDYSLIKKTFHRLLQASMLEVASKKTMVTVVDKL